MINVVDLWKYVYVIFEILLYYTILEFVVS